MTMATWIRPAHALLVEERAIQKLWLVGVCAALLSGPAHAITVDWVTVGNPGNTCDTQPQGCFGAVTTPYLIGKTEVTNTQYAEFLNAKAASDPNGLYNTNMGSAPPANFGGITRSGTDGSYTYSTIAGGLRPQPNCQIRINQLGI